MSKNNRIIQIALYFFWGLTLFASLLETFTYSGFFEKHFRVNFSFLFFITLILGFVILIFPKYGRDIIPEKLYKIDKILLFFLVFLFLSFSLLELATYKNFVFSKFHIQIVNLGWPILVCLYLILVKKIYSKNPQKDRGFTFLFLAVFFWVLTLNIMTIYSMFDDSLRYLIRNPRADYGDKMSQRIGKQFYDYTLFINKNTPENSRLLIPPQGFPWPQSGNAAYLRYFVYPRDVSNGDEYKAPDFKKAGIDYVLLDWGEADKTEYGYTHGWPKFDVPAEEIILIGAGGKIEVTKGNYVYEKYKDKNVWGLIKVKK